MSNLANYTHVAPHSDELEQAVLGAMLNGEAAGLLVGLSVLRGNQEIFYQPCHRVVFQAICHLHNAGRAVDVASAIHQLMVDGTLTKAGGHADVAALSIKASGHNHVHTHCLLLIELYSKRKVGEVARQLQAKAFDPMQDCFELFAEAQRTLNSLHDVMVIKRPMLVGELYDQVMDDVDAATQRPQGLTGVPSGLAILDKATGGFQNSDLIIIAARPGMGKTSLALSIARSAAGEGLPGAFFSLEMKDRQLVRKMVASEANYTMSTLTRGNLRGGLDEARYIREKAAGLRRLPLLIDETASLSIGELRAKASKLKAEHDIRFLIVDYLQLMTGDKSGNREQEIASISRALKAIAKELDIPVLALAQLSRDVEKRGGTKKPGLADLRESGAIEQDADVIIFPYRAEYYGIEQDSEGCPTKDTTELIIAKHRNGATTEVLVRSVMSKGQYSDFDEVPALAAPAPGEQFGPRLLSAAGIQTESPSDFDDHEDC